jgi:ribosomal protein S18 acetylase RimI-like enzyme
MLLGVITSITGARPRARISFMHVLDNPVWHALIGSHAAVAQRALYAARYEPEVAVFGAIPDDPAPAAWDGLREIISPGARALLARRTVEVPPPWSTQLVAPCRQMVLPSRIDLDGTEDRSVADASFSRLTAHDVPEMLALVERTRPGPFARRTIELGTYLGVRRDGALIAMAGERLHPAGFTEISAVCTDPAFRGTGLASHLVRAVVRGIRVREETPFLHLTMDNERAHRVYSALGFETRTFLDVIAVQAPS